MKFKLLSSVLILLIIASFTLAIILSLRLENTNTKLNESLELLAEANDKYIALEKKANEDLEKCLNDGTKSKWEIALGTNTLEAYSMFVENCTGEEDCHQDELKTAIDKLLNAKGYVQIVETDGNELFTKAKLSLEGEFIKLNKDTNVRNGAIGKDIDNCGTSNPVKTGVVLKDRVVKVIDKCEATGSQSVWAHIQYTN